MLLEDAFIQTWSSSICQLSIVQGQSIPRATLLGGKRLSIPFCNVMHSLTMKYINEKMAKENVAVAQVKRFNEIQLEVAYSSTLPEG